MISIFKKSIFLILFLSMTIYSNGQSLLWIVEGNGLEKPSYLYGSMHEMCKQDFKWDTKLDGVCDYTRQVYFEVDLDNIFEFFRNNKFSKVSDKEYSLQKLYSDEDYKLIQRYFQDSLKVKIEKYDNRSPLFLMINSSGRARNSTCKRRKSYEKEFMKFYHQGHLLIENSGRIFGLESAYERDSILRRIPFERQAEILLKLIKQAYELNINTSTSNNEFSYEQMIKEYFEMDIEKMYSSTKKEMEYDDLYKVLLDDRNNLWINKMPKIMKKKSTFFVVGVAHLGGEKGIVNLLKKQGYTVRPLKLDMQKW
jgi:uncharacterized protein